MKFDVRVSEIMNSNVKKVSPNTSVSEVAKIMKETKIGSVIVDTDPTGIITATDIIHNYVAEKKGETAKDVMTTDLICISPTETIEKAAKLMADKNIEKLPVMEDENMIGIITATDVLKIEPALFEILVEQVGMDPEVEGKISGSYECESCGNYTEDVREIDSRNLCSKCSS